MNIMHLNGNVTKKDGTTDTIMNLLGVSASPLDIPNDGRGNTISAFVADGKQYALSDILEQLGGAIGGLTVHFTGSGASGNPYKADRTFDEMKAASPLHITWNGTPASEIKYTKSSGNITKITARFISFGSGTMTVTTLEVNSSGVSGSSAEYTLTANE